MADARSPSPDLRGTEALANKAGATHLLQSGATPHYCFILDRSDKGRQVLALMKNGPEALQARVNSAAFAVWESAPHFQFVVIWGTFGYSGGLTIPTMDMSNLLAGALPAVMERTVERSGLCAFMVETDPALADQIQARIAELQLSVALSGKPS